jgi:Ca2+-binding RTX toxin-like protein
MTWIRRLALPAVAGLLCLGAAPAQATLFVQSDSTGLLVKDETGNGDELTILSGTRGGDPVYVVQSTNPFDFFKFRFGANCSQGATGDKAVCNRLSGKLNMDTGFASDFVDVSGSGATSAQVNLGTMGDTYTGIPGPDNVFAASGDDTVNTGDGNDDVRISDGKDRVDAGSGDDRVTVGTSGSAGGNDFISAGPGNDNIDIQQPGNPFTNVSVLGGPGDDRIRTQRGDDMVVGDAGVDDIETGQGRDQIFVKEDLVGTRDTVACGFDQDQVTADLRDKVDAISNPGGGTCEEVDRSPVGETPHVKILGKTLRVSPTGDVRVRLRCPRGVKGLGCKGSLQLRVARTRKRGVQASRSRNVRYKIRASKRKTVRLRLSSKDVSTLRRGKRTRGILVSVEKGRKGRKTTVRNPRLKLRRS